MMGKLEQDGAVLCLLTRIKMVGIHLLPGVDDDLDWKRISSAPLVFEVDFCRMNLPLGICHFDWDSNIFLSGGFCPDESPNHQIYKFNVKKESLLTPVAYSIPLPPVPLGECLVSRIVGNTYFLQFQGNESNFLVLDSTLRWEQLPPPPGPGDECVVLHDKLYYLQSYGSGEHVYCFDPDTKSWMQEQYEKDDDHFLNCFHIRVNEKLQFFPPKLTVSPQDFGDWNIMLAWSSIEVGNECCGKKFAKPLLKVRIFAFLGCQQRVLLHQPLDELFEGIEPSFYEPPECMLVDLGNNMVCAVICGRAIEHLVSPIVCISVFTLGKVKRDRVGSFLFAPVGRFVYARVLAKHVYTMKDFHLPLLEAFVWRDKNTKNVPEKEGSAALRCWLNKPF